MAPVPVVCQHIQRAFPAATVHCFGASDPDIERFLSLALAEANVVSRRSSKFVWQLFRILSLTLAFFHSSIFSIEMTLSGLELKNFWSESRYMSPHMGA